MQKPERRVYGPYEHRRRWRVVLRSDGEKSIHSFGAKTEADAFADAARGEASSGLTVSEAVDAYIKSLAERGLKFGTYQRAENHLKRLLQLEQNGRRRVTWLNRRGQALYDATIGKSVDTHRNALAAGKAFGAWCVARRVLRVNPFENVAGVGRRRRGKPQLTVDESRALLARCLELWERDRRPEVVAVAAALLLGARATEVVVRDVRDLDDGGRLLWIPSSKTEAGKRCLEVPEVLRPMLLELAQDRIGTAPLFRKLDGERATRHWLGHHTRKITTALGRRVTPHGLRGTHTSLARRAGATGELVASQLGHASVGMQIGTYASADAITAGTTRTLMRVISGGKHLGNTAGSGNRDQS